MRFSRENSSFFPPFWRFNNKLSHRIPSLGIAPEIYAADITWIRANTEEQDGFCRERFEKVVNSRANLSANRKKKWSDAAPRKLATNSPQNLIQRGFSPMLLLVFFRVYTKEKYFTGEREREKSGENSRV